MGDKEIITAVSAAVGMAIAVFIKSIAGEAGKKLIAFIPASVFFSILLTASLLIGAYVVVNKTDVLRYHASAYQVQNVIGVIANSEAIWQGVCPEENAVNQQFAEPIYSEANRLAGNLRGINLVTLNLFRQWDNVAYVCSQYYVNGVPVSARDIEYIVENNVDVYKGIPPDVIQLIQTWGRASNAFADISGRHITTDVIGRLTVSNDPIILETTAYIPLRGLQETNTLRGYVRIITAGDTFGSKNGGIISAMERIRLRFSRFITERKSNLLTTALERER